MGVPGNADLLLLKTAAAAGGYQVSRSLRFNSADSAYLSRTPASAGNRKTWTWAGWVKRSGLAANQALFEAGNGSVYTLIWFNSSDKLGILEDQGGGGLYFPYTAAVFRDTSAWYHIVVAVDTTQATSTNRIKIYVNGVLQTIDNSYPSQNLDTYVNSTNAHRIGYRVGNSAALSGYLADVHFIDGQALTPSSFAETDATTGQWIPKLYTGSYGTNGFKLTFADNSAATAAALGKDSAGSNNWTPNNFSVTAGAGNDSLVDTPTSYGTDTGAGGEVRGNYATYNRIASSAISSNWTITNGNLDASGSATNQNPLPSTIFPSSGKWYCEFVRNSGTDARFGVINTSGLGEGLGGGSNGWAWLDDGRLYYQSSVTSYGTAISNGDVVMIALDIDNGRVWYGRNGTWFASGNPATGTNPSQSFTAGQAMSPAVASGSACSITANWGARPFAYTAPSGFKALCDTNLTAPVIAKPSTVMDVLVFAATNANNTSITGLSFQPDLVWGKSRTNAYSHQLYDSVRGVNKNLKSNTTGAEVTDTVGLTSFDSNGFTAGVDFNVILGSGSSVAWCWDAGSSTVTNTQGSITSSVRANASAGFSIVTFTAPSSGNFTVGHGLNVTPQFMIIKGRDSNSSGYNWRVFHSSVCDTVRKMLALNTTDAIVVSGSDVWGSALPTSTVFGATAGNTVGGNGTAIAYCFAPVTGYSSAFSYTGNGSSDGPAVWLGFKPALILVKRTDSTGDWRIWDMRRDGYNVTFGTIAPNSSSAENTSEGAGVTGIDFLSSGFKLRSTGTFHNASGGTYIGFAWAESPFQYARAR